MFSRKIIVIASFFVLTLPGRAMGHDFWMQGQATKAGQKLTAEIGFGHDFPKTEPLPAEMASGLNPVQVHGAKGAVELEPGEDNNVFVSKKGIAKGSYYVTGSTKGNVFTTGPDGYAQKYKNEVPGAVECNEYIMYGKGIINVESAGELDFLTQPLGQKLELVPQVLPTSIKAGEALLLLVLYDGNPLAWADVSATFAGFAPGDLNAKAFASKSDKQGVVSFVPQVDGYWKITVSHKTPYANKDMCDHSNYTSSFVLKVGK